MPVLNNTDLGSFCYWWHAGYVAFLSIGKVSVFVCRWRLLQGTSMIRDFHLVWLSSSVWWFVWVLSICCQAYFASVLGYWISNRTVVWWTGSYLSATIAEERAMVLWSCDGNTARGFISLRFSCPEVNIFVGRAGKSGGWFMDAWIKSCTLSGPK
jgi:hypothetical protein